MPPTSGFLKSGPRHHKCAFVDIEKEDGNDYSFTNIQSNQLWANAKISWQFVSSGDEYKRASFYEDANIGLSKADVDTAIKAMKLIEEKTCFRFEHQRERYPPKGEPWLLLYRIGKHTDRSCQLSYVQQNLIGKDIARRGNIFDNLRRASDEDVCFGGAFANYGSDNPQRLVLSQMNQLDKEDEFDVGLIVHELLHNLGLGHTQKRQDAKDHIDIYWKNIEELSQSQYEPCTEEKDPACKYYNTYGTPYDCSSIMHYGDRDFLTDEAEQQEKKTMKAKDASTCELSPYGTIKLSETDVDLINKMYNCKS